MNITTSSARQYHRTQKTCSPHSSPGAYPSWTGNHRWAPPRTYSASMESDGTEVTVLSSSCRATGRSSDNKLNGTRNGRQGISFKAPSTVDTHPTAMMEQMQLPTTIRNNVPECESRRGTPLYSSLPVPSPQTLNLKIGVANTSSSLKSMIAAVNRANYNDFTEESALGLSVSWDETSH